MFDVESSPARSADSPDASSTVGRAQTPPRLEVAGSGPTEGHITLVWSVDDTAGELVFELQEAPTTEFAAAQTCYTGGDRASFRSGLPAGEHAFRVRSRPQSSEAWSAWSEAVTIDIRPYPLAKAWTLFGIGAFLVVAITGYLFVASRRRNES